MNQSTDEQMNQLTDEQMNQSTKQLGICMDRSHALLMELENNHIISRNIVSGLNETDKVDIQDTHFLGFQWSEKQHLQKVYFTEISDIIKHYQQVVLFGPTDAKDELYKLVEANRQFHNIKIKLANTDRMTEVQMHEFVKEYYKLSI
jgi:hypothetical protein